jgi:autotransporter-associated beta strand protein
VQGFQAGFNTNNFTLTTITVVDSPVTVQASGLSFEAPGYLITGNPLLLIPTPLGNPSRFTTPTITVAANPLTAAPFDATIDSTLQGASGLDKIGSGRLTLGSSVYSGLTTVAAGTLRAGSTEAFSPNSSYTFGPRPPFSPVYVAATLDLNGFSNTIGSLSTTNIGTGTAIVTNNGTMPAILTVGNDNTSTTFSGTIQDGTSVLALTKIGTGTLTLTGTNSYSGGTTITAGTLQAGATTALSPNSAFNVAATLDLNGFSNTIGSLSGPAIVTNNATMPAILTVGSDHTSTTFSGTIQDGTSVLALTKIGTGTLTLTGTNSYSGGTTISGGTLQIGNGGPAGNIVGNVLDNGTLAFNRSGDKKNFNGMISGSGNLVKLGSDTLVLTANNTYSGGTIIEAGTLVAGVPTAGQATSFALGEGNVFLVGGTLRTPSLDPLIIHVGGNYTQGPNGTLALGVAGVDGSQYDHVVAGGSASVAGTLSVFSLGGFAPADGNAFEVVRGAGGRSGTYSTINDQLNLNHLQRVDIYAKNSVILLYLTPKEPRKPGQPTPPPIDEQDPNFVVPPVNPNEPLPEPEVDQLVDPTAEELTSLYQIGFSAATMQRFSLGDRMFQIQ